MIVPPVQSPAAIEARIENPQDIVSTQLQSPQSQYNNNIAFCA